MGSTELDFWTCLVSTLCDYCNKFWYGVLQNIHRHVAVVSCITFYIEPRV